MTLVQKAATVFGVVFFEVNGVHNAIHLISGVAALALSRTHKNARLYFQVFGIVYGLVTLLGVFHGDNDLLGIVAHNVADIFLHLIITAAALYFGFGTPRDSDVIEPSAP
jgi:hypothetical protein